MRKIKYFAKNKNIRERATHCQRYIKFWNTLFWQSTVVQKLIELTFNLTLVFIKIWLYKNVVWFLKNVVWNLVFNQKEPQRLLVIWAMTWVNKFVKVFFANLEVPKWHKTVLSFVCCKTSTAKISELQPWTFRTGLSDGYR